MSYLHNFHYNLWGQESKPKLVFLHGLMGSGINWRRIIGEFENDYHVLAFDQRGHGRSFQPETGYSPNDYAEDLKKILDELGWQKVNLVGHSMGARNALHFAHKYPDRVEKLVIEDVSPEASQQGMDRIVHLIELVPTPFESKKRAREFFMNEYEKLIADNPIKKTLSQYFYTNIMTLEDGRADWRFSKKGVVESLERGRDKSQWREFQELSVPTLVIKGENSTDLSLAHYEKMLASNRLVQGQIVKGAGHWVHFDQSESFIRIVREFLQNTR